MIGQVIGNYRIVDELGKGGMGLVYRAEHIQLGRPAALKMLLPQFSSDQAIVQRFFNEARAASAIDHPGIVEIYDFGTHTDGRAYIVMALLKGESLEQRLARGPLAPVDGATILAQVAAALGAAHQRGIIHRDLKPDNIYLVPNELVPGGLQVKLLDFGIAKLADEKAAGFKTQTGTLMGTPAYMSPEQCMGGANLDHRTDIYSIGCILFHVLTGRPPFTSDQGTGMMIAAHIRDAAPDPRTINPNIPPLLAGVIMRCLEKEPAARYQSANDLRNALVGAGANAPLSRAPTPVAQYGATLPPTANYAVGTAPTTHSQSAAQMLSQPPAAKTKSKAPVFIGVGAILAAIAGVGVVVAINKSDKPAQVASEQPLDNTASKVPDPAPAIPSKPAPVPEAEKPTPQEPPRHLECAPGQMETADTKGHCCWPDQAWSSSKNRCIGKPKCPDGMAAKAEQCIAVVDPKGNPTSTAVATGGPTFKLGAASYAPGDKIEIRFNGALPSPDRNRAWVTVIEVGKPATSYGAWDYVKDGATSTTLPAPSTPGAYEVRLHTDYPTKAFNIRHVVPVTIAAGATTTPPTTTPPTTTPPTPPATGASETPVAQQRFKLAAKSVPGGGFAKLKFFAPMNAAKGEQFWVTVVEPDKDMTSYGHYEYVPAGATQMKIAVPTAPGDYEVRLHANYPTKSTNVVHRVKIRVEAAP